MDFKVGGGSFRLILHSLVPAEVTLCLCACVWWGAGGGGEGCLVFVLQIGGLGSRQGSPV